MIKILKKYFVLISFFVFLMFIFLYSVNAAEEPDKCSMGSAYNKYSPNLTIISNNNNEYVLKIDLDESINSNVKYYYRYYKDGSSVIFGDYQCSNDGVQFHEIKNREDKKKYCYVDVKKPFYIKLTHEFEYSFSMIFANYYYTGTGEFLFGNEHTELTVDVEDPDCTCPNECKKNVNASNCVEDCKKYGKMISSFEIYAEGLGYSPSVTEISTDDDYFSFNGSYGKRIECNSDNYESDFEEKFCMGYKKGITKSLNQTLKCDYKKTYKESDLEGENYYKNVDYFYKESTESTPVAQYSYKAAGRSDGDSISCDKVCQESIEVKYGPPVTSKAGMCFEYKVKVISRTNCYGKLSGSAPTKYKVCTPSPYCTDGVGVYSTAGPNDSFDSCVKSCDGGKYTKKCSQSCYKQIYSFSNNKTFSNNINSLNVSKVADNNDTCSRDDDGTLFCDNTCTYCSNKKYGGYYYRNGNGIMWHGEEMSNYSEKIYSYYSRWLGGGVSFRCNGSNNLFYAGRWYNENQNWGFGSTDSYCVPYSAGFYRAYLQSGGYCQDRCSWTGCGNDYYYVNAEDFYYEYAENKKIYDAAKKMCEASSVCTTSTDTQTVSFNMKVNTSNGNVKMPKDSDDFIKVKKNGFDSDSRDNTNTTLLYETGGTKSCYDSGTDNTHISRATWRLPGTYFNLKTGAISYELDDSITNLYFKYNNRFCTKLTQKNVNRAWWNYYMSQYKDDLSFDYNNYDKQCMNSYTNYESFFGKISNPKNINAINPSWNITASTKNFGLFGWNININCFYAINNCFDSNKGKGYVIRTVDTSNLFPKKNGEKLSDLSSTGRTPGFNWTSSSISNNNKEYVIDPPKLIKSIQKKSSSSRGIYSKDDLDYEFVITPQDFYEFRNSSDKDYNSFGVSNNYLNPNSVDRKPSNGVARYYSTFITNLASKHNTKRPQESSMVCNNIAPNGNCE